MVHQKWPFLLPMGATRPPTRWFKVRAIRHSVRQFQPKFSGYEPITSDRTLRTRCGFRKKILLDRRAADGRIGM
jgi:hypothetical protein